MPFTFTMRRRLVALVCCLGILLSQSAPTHAQAPVPPDAPSNIAEHTVVITGRKTQVEIVERFSKLIEAPGKLKRVDGFDPEICSVTADTPRRIRVQALMQGLTVIVLTDETGKQYQIEVFVKGDARHLQAVINSRFPDSSIEAYKVQESVVLAGWVSQPDHITQIVEIAEQFFPKVLNQVRVGGVQQVKLKCKIMEVQRSRLRRMGFNFLANKFDGGYIASTPGQLTSLGSATLSPGSSSAGLTAATLGAASLAFGAVTDSFAIQAFFDALRQEELLKILAEPILVTMNGRPAVMLSGGEFPILVPQSLGTTTIEWRDFGVRMETVPIILGDGRVRMEVMPEVSERDFANSVTVNGTSVPGLTVRRVNTQVEMKFGQTLMLAGLLSWRQTAQTQKIPFLGELPYAGALFRRVRYEDVETELVILLTPELVGPIDGSAMPAGGPGRFTDIVTDRELFGYGMMEVPSYGERCDTCNGQGCPSCQHQHAIPMQPFTLPIQEVHEAPKTQGGGSDPVTPVLPPVPAGNESAQRSGPRSNSAVANSTTRNGGGQQVGHTQSGTRNSNANASYSAPQTPPSYSRSTQIGQTPKKTPTRTRPALIEP